MTFPSSNQEFLSEDTFNCVKCGECCRHVVKVSEQDVERIKELGISNFTEFDKEINSMVLKQKNNVCMFLKKENDKFICSIYNHRPQVCRKYPFIRKEKLKDCRPKGWERWIPIERVFNDS